MFIKAPIAYQNLILYPLYWSSFRNALLSNRRFVSFGQGCPKKTVAITQEIVEQLERISLVDFANKKGIERLQSAIEFADRINHVDTSGVEPMVTVLKDRSIYLRNDKVDDGNCRESVMSNAAIVEEEYFVAPPGNIPVAPSKPILEEYFDAI